jgi:tetratricopeptide (TPR) repeat protein
MRKRVDQLLAFLLTITCVVLPSVILYAAQPDAAQKAYQQAVTFFREGQYDGATEALKKAITLQPQYAEAHHLLGLVYFQGKKDPVEAIEALKKAVRLKPAFSEALYDLGRIYLSQAKYQEGEQALARAIELAPRSEDARLALAKLYTRSGKPTKAIQAYQALLALKPRHS